MDKDSRDINISNSFYPHRAKSKGAVCPEIQSWVLYSQKRSQLLQWHGTMFINRESGTWVKSAR